MLLHKDSCEHCHAKNIFYEEGLEHKLSKIDEENFFAFKLKEEVEEDFANQDNDKENEDV